MWTRREKVESIISLVAMGQKLQRDLLDRVWNTIDFTAILFTS